MLLKNGSRGDEVKDLQKRLGQLGFELEVDGIFGKETEASVIQLQKLFNYSVDGKVGDGTTSLIDAQIGYGWNVNSADAAAKAARSNPTDAPPGQKDAAIAKAKAVAKAEAVTKGKPAEKGTPVAKGKPVAKGVGKTK